MIQELWVVSVSPSYSMYQQYRKRMSIYNSVKLRKNVSDNEGGHFSDVKKLKKDYVDLIMCEIMPDSFRIKQFF